MKIRVCVVCVTFIMATIINSEAANYFKEQEAITFAVNSALKESMIAGYHGSIAKTIYYIDDGTHNPDKRNMDDFLAWYNIANAYRVIESSIEVTPNSKDKERLE